MCEDFFWRQSKLSSLMFSFCIPFPGVEWACLQKKDSGLVCRVLILSSMHCTMNIATAWHLICCFCFPPQKGFFALYIQARQSVLGHEIPRSCDAICHIWSWSCFGTHRPLFSDHILQDQGSPRSKTLSITNLRSGADISLADKSNPIWSKLTALHRFLCEFSLVWLVGRGS